MRKTHLIFADDLLLDERFLSWARGESSAADIEWLVTLRNISEEQDLEIAEALYLFRAIAREEKKVLGIEEQREQLLLRLERAEVPATLKKRSFFDNHRLTLYGMLGVLLVAAIITGVSILPSNTRRSLTGNGQVTLMEDGTKVLLTPTSTLTYQEGLVNAKSRDVWVQGEANFQVSHLTDEKPFIVHTNAFFIEVTGTKFTVNNTSELVSVLLQEGSVNLHFPTGEIVKMKPGDFFSLTEHVQNGATQEPASPTSLERQIVFDNTPFYKVVEEIESRYDVKVNVLNEELSSKLITGILPNNNLTIFLRALESAMDCVIIQENEKIYIKTFPKR